MDVALNEVPLFIRSGKCIPVAEAAECVKDILIQKICSLSDMKAAAILCTKMTEFIKITTRKKIIGF